MLLLLGSRLEGRYDALCGLPTRLPGESTAGPVMATASAAEVPAVEAASDVVAGFSGLAPGPVPFDVADWFWLLRPPRFGGASGFPFAWPLSAPVWLPLSVPVLLPTPSG